MKRQALIAKLQREYRARKTESKNVSNAAKGLPPIHSNPGKLSATGTVRSTAGRRKTNRRRR